MENQKIESILPELEENYDNLPSDPNQLLSEHEHQRMNADLTRIADLRRRVEVESRNIRIA